MPRLNGRKIEAMYRKYGPGPVGLTCGDCRHCFLTIPTERRYWKCELYGNTAGESTDWVKRWPACGKFNQDSDERPVIEQLKHEPRSVQREEIKGQLKMEV